MQLDSPDMLTGVREGDIDGLTAISHRHSHSSDFAQEVGRKSDEGLQTG